MYIVRFVRVDKQPNEEYLYKKEEDAMYHFSLFEEDGSWLYSLIEVVQICENQELQIAKMILEY